MRGNRTLILILAVLGVHSYGRLIIDMYVFVVLTLLCILFLTLDAGDLGMTVPRNTTP